MKYIRTKKGKVYETIGKSDHDYFVCYSNDPGDKHVHSTEVEKEADTIGELCDEYVLESKDHSYRTLLMKSGAYDDKISLFGGFVKDVKNGWVSCCLHYLQEGRTIYGAIWTNKGLIYIAKMNVKGELELL